MTHTKRHLSWLLAFAPLLVGLACGGESQVVAGKRLAGQYCQSCHLYPEPGLLPRRTWAEDVLPKMGALFGRYDTLGRQYYLEPGTTTADNFPEDPLISAADWEAIVTYYTTESPDSLPAPSAPERVDTVDWFTPSWIGTVGGPHLTTLARADSAGRIAIGGILPFTNPFTLYDPAGNVLQRRTLTSPVVSWARHKGTDYLACAGRLNPSDRADGSVVALPADPEDPLIDVRDSLRRPVDLAFTAAEELIVAEFGHVAGSLSLRGADGTIRQLAANSGWSQIELTDWDGDGRQDFLALAGQGDERLDVFYGRPEGGYRRQNLLRWPPSYGTISFELADLDGDGTTEVLTSHGDNADYTPFPKPYHGLRHYRRTQDGGLRLANFYALPGAFSSVTGDYDRDGDADIAVIAHFPDHQSATANHLWLLEQTQPGNFTPRTTPQSNAGRWITMDRTPDGLLLASFSAFAVKPDPHGWNRRWREFPSVMRLVVD